MAEAPRRFNIEFSATTGFDKAVHQSYAAIVKPFTCPVASVEKMIKY